VWTVVVDVTLSVYDKHTLSDGTVHGSDERLWHLWLVSVSSLAWIIDEAVITKTFSASFPRILGNAQNSGSCPLFLWSSCCVWLRRLHLALQEQLSYVGLHF